MVNAWLLRRKATGATLFSIPLSVRAEKGIDEEPEGEKEQALAGLPYFLLLKILFDKFMMKSYQSSSIFCRGILKVDASIVCRQDGVIPTAVWGEEWKAFYLKPTADETKRNGAS